MTPTTARPILFSGPMVLAILAGTKTQTRRVIKDRRGFNQPLPLRRCPYGVPGDRLIVREAAWMWCERRKNGTTKTGRQRWRYVPLRNVDPIYCANAERPNAPPTTSGVWGDDNLWRYKHARYLPRWASRITLAVEAVRVERVQDITEEDARSEGITDGGCLSCGCSEPCGCLDPRPDARDAFAYLWMCINDKRPGCGWHDDPWVWVVSFRRVTP